MITRLSLAETAAFTALVVALGSVWFRAFVRSRYAARLWTIPFAGSLAAAYAGGVIDLIGLLAILTFGSLCVAARRATTASGRGAAHVAVLAMTAGLYLHLIPGFANPLVIAGAVLTPDAVPFTKYLNFDKGVAALLLLGLYVPECTARDDGIRHVPAFLWRFAVIVTVVMLLSLSVGHVRWDVKVAPWWLTWGWTMVFMTALPEETLFRGIVQTGIARWCEGRRHATALAVTAAALLFGIAHSGGGLTYVALASVAGLGYGWVYASTRSLAAAIVAHAGLNAVHFVFFTYPAIGLGVRS